MVQGAAINYLII